MNWLSANSPYSKTGIICGCRSWAAERGTEDRPVDRLADPLQPGRSLVGESVPTEEQAAVPGADPSRLFLGLEGADDGLLLLDTRGLRLGGGLTSPEGDDVADAVSAHLAGVSQEASRTARLLGLGAWISLAAESPDGHLFVVAPTPETLLLLVREQSVPLGRLAVVADHAAGVARAWLEGLQ